CVVCVFFFFQAEDGIRDATVTGVQTCALPILPPSPRAVLSIVDWNWHRAGVDLSRRRALIFAAQVAHRLEGAAEIGGAEGRALQIGRASCRERVESAEGGGGVRQRREQEGGRT